MTDIIAGGKYHIGNDTHCRRRKIPAGVFLMRAVSGSSSKTPTHSRCHTGFSTMPVTTAAGPFRRGERTRDKLKTLPRKVIPAGAPVTFRQKLVAENS